MKKFYTGIVRHRKLVICFYFIVTIICAVLQNLVSVNYDMNDYLPPDSASTVSLDVMEAEFDGGIPNARVMIRDVTIPEVLDYKEKLKDIDGVTEVTWLNDTIDVMTPMELMDQDVVELYYKDGCALFTVTIDEGKRVEGVEEIQDMIGDDNALTGSAVSTAHATVSTVSEIAKIAAFAVVFVLFILILTTNSWFEPIVVLGGLGVAIAINAGTNLIFGEISFVTNAAGNVLQLAVSLDYSVFLIHRFEECLQEKSTAEEAMVDALCKSTGSIASSGLTTVIGFLALILMRFQIGPDLGLALAKGVALSLVTVFTFMTAFILCTHKLLKKTRHRSFMPGFHGFGKLVRKVMIPGVVIFVILIVPSYLASNSNKYYYGSSHMFDTETRIGADTQAIEEVFGKSDTYVLLVPRGDTSTEKALSEELQEIPEVSNIISYVDMVGAEIPAEYLDQDTLKLLESEHYSRMVISVDVDYEGEKTFDLVKEIRNTAQKYYPEDTYLAGEGVSTYDLMDTITADMVKVNFVAILAVFIVLLLMQRNLALPIILVMSIETAIWINLSIPYFKDSNVFYIAYLIISSVQLGATVDYAILMSDRYRENRAGMNKKDAVAETISNVTVSVLTSGIVLSVVGFLLSHFSSNKLLAQLGSFLGVGALCSLAIVLFVLPGLLYLFDRFFIRHKKTA